MAAGLPDGSREVDDGPRDALADGGALLGEDGEGVGRGVGRAVGRGVATGVGRGVGRGVATGFGVAPRIVTVPGPMAVSVLSPAPVPLMARYA